MLGLVGVVGVVVVAVVLGALGPLPPHAIITAAAAAHSPATRLNRRFVYITRFCQPRGRTARASSAAQRGVSRLPRPDPHERHAAGPGGAARSLTAGIPLTQHPANVSSHLGVFFSCGAAIAMASTVSPLVGLLMISLYLAHHVIEHHMIGPRIYSSRLRLSTPALLIALAAGTELAGMAGALLALPIAAVYPSVARVWLREPFGDEAIAEHERLRMESVTNG